MLSTLVIALAVTGQSPNYDLIADEPEATIKTARGNYKDDKVTALADARAKVRAYTRALASAREQVSELSQDIAKEATPRARIQDMEGYESAPTIYSGPEPVRRVTPVRSATRVTYQTADPAAAGSSCYSSSYQPVAPSTQMPATVYESAPQAGSSCYSSAYRSAPSPYSSAPALVYQSAPMSYATTPVMYDAVPADFGSNVTTINESTRVGLFGRLRQNRRSRSVSSGAPMSFATMPMSSGFAGFFSGAACVSGSCR